MSYDPSGRYSVGVCDVEFLKTGCSGADDITADKHLVGRIFYPCNRSATAADAFKKANWLPSWEYAKGYGSFLTAWGKPSIAKTFLKPVITLTSYWLGHQALADNFMGAPLVDGAEEHPVVLFSHGIGGTRTSYSGICTELGSAGFVVLAVEHADGTAATVQLAGGAGHKFYSGWLSEEERMGQTRYRMRELITAHSLLAAMHEGRALPGLGLGSGLDPGSLFAGRLQMGAVSLMGHSYGGASITALGAEDARFKCGVALDPWWGALVPDQAALGGWASESPLLIMGSHTWNIPNDKGRLFCDGEKQDTVFAASAKGAGAVHLVLKGSGHDSFNDIVQLVALRYRRTMHYFRIFKQHKSIKELHASLALPLVANASLAFLARHLTLSAPQRARIEGSLQANSRRLERFEQTLAAAEAKGQRAAAAKDAPPPHFASMGTEAAATSHDDAQDAEAATAAAQFAGGEERALASSEGARQDTHAAGSQQSIAGRDPVSEKQGKQDSNHAAAEGRPAQASSDRASQERKPFEEFCRGYIHILKVYGFKEPVGKTDSENGKA